MPYLDEKPAWKSGTLYGTTGGAITAVGVLIHGIKTGNALEIGQGALALWGFFTAWRLRKGAGVSISGTSE